MADPPSAAEAGLPAARPLDLHFAALVGRLAASDDPALHQAAALASLALGQGHVCVDLAVHAETPFALPAPWPQRLPALNEWRLALQGHPGVVGDAADPGPVRHPLVLDASDRLYLGRYFDLERRLARALAQRLGTPQGLDPPRLREGLGRLFPGPAQTIDWQQVAAALALTRGLSLISGGPGTGKTRTVARILALFLEQAGAAATPLTRPLRIALAAPTGKAAARLAESIDTAVSQLPVAATIAAAIPRQATTLHRLLGARPGRSGLRYHADRPLAVDLLVVDEASMVDLPLMTRTLEALPPQARLLLIGDKDQLASVEAGSVLGDLCGEHAGRGYAPATATALQGLCRGQIPVDPGAGPLQDAVAVLRHSYRFGHASGIGRLAAAVNTADAGTAEALLAAGHDDLAWQAVEDRRLVQFVAGRALAAYRPYLSASEPGEALAAFDRYRVLSALRDGPVGVTALNQAIEQRLAAEDLIRPDSEWYHGRPVLIRQNDHGARLYNGDIGLCLRDPAASAAQGREVLRVWFPTGEVGAPRPVLPGRLPPHQTVYAMTVHKSQGSEFDRLLFVLPEARSPVLTRELLYTAITRARRQVELVGPIEALRAGIARRVQRASGLAEHPALVG